MNGETFQTVLSIVIICYLIGLATKSAGVNSKFIPVIVGVVGGILGIVGMNVIPNFPAQNVMDAIAVGIGSGLASTGADQMIKQLTGYYNEKNA